MPMRALIAIAALLAPAAALAAPACELPKSLPRPHAEGPTEREPKRLLPIAGYTLALSWAPAYCRAHGGEAAAGIECGSRSHFGFTLHGLWPDGPGKDWPQYCRPAALLPETVLRAALCATPSPQLLQHEWAKHGTCTGSDAKDYFATAGRLYRGIAYPDMDALARRPQLGSADFRRAFAAANRGMSPDMIRLNLDPKGWLEEVWLCLGRNLRPRRCAATAGGAAADANVRIRPSAAPASPRAPRSRDGAGRDGAG